MLVSGPSAAKLYANVGTRADCCYVDRGVFQRSPGGRSGEGLACGSSALNKGHHPEEACGSERRDLQQEAVRGLWTAL